MVTGFLMLFSYPALTACVIHYVGNRNDDIRDAIRIFEAVHVFRKADEANAQLHKKGYEDRCYIPNDSLTAPCRKNQGWHLAPCCGDTGSSL